MKNSNKTILAVSIISVVTCGIIGLTPTKANKNGEGIIVSTPSTNEGIVLNASEIKMKNVGDTFILEASINSDATFKSITFTSSDEDAISVTKMSDTSCKLTKLTDFTEYVEITAVSDDPFVDLSTSCFVRAYNNLSYLFGDIYWSAYKDDVDFEIEDQYKFLLVEGASYEVQWEVGTDFGSLDENEYPLTYKLVEEEDLKLLEENIQNLFGNNEITFLDSYINEGKNYIDFSFTYEFDIFENKTEKNLYFPYLDMDVSWHAEKYIPASNISIINEGILVI